MEPLRISIIIPCYNQAAFLDECLRSLVAQTFQAWEAIVVDDASTEDITAVVANAGDPRIRLTRHASNRGLGASRNTGFKLSAAAFVLPLDADDALTPDALEEMLAEFDDDPAADCVFANFELFGAQEEVWHFVVKDMAMFTREQWIPGAGWMMRRTLWEKAGGYCEAAELRGGNEDWDFWLSAAEHGFRTLHIPRPLYRYRQHAVSMALTLRLIDFDTRQFIYARHREFFDAHGGPARFLADGCWRAAQASRKAGELGAELAFSMRALRLHFDRARLRATARSIIKQLVPEPARRTLRAASDFMQRQMLRVLGCVAQIAGGIAGAFMRNRSALFFFFPSYEIGGAEKVHADILSAFREAGPWVFFTQRSPNAHFRPLFEGLRVFELERWTRAPFRRELTVRFVAGFVNAHPGAAAFGGNSPFFYEMLTSLGPHVRAADIVHAFGGGMEECSLPVARRLDARVVITGKTRRDFAEQYRAAGIDAALIDRVVVIPNRVSVRDDCARVPRTGELRVLYVGRGTAEKRVHLVARIARVCDARRRPIKFCLAGDVAGALSPRERRLCELLGEVRAPDALEALYAKSDVLLLTSSREGLPLVLMEAMGAGVVPICTAVGGIPEHVQDGSTGFLLCAPEDEAGVVAQAVAFLERLAADRALLESISARAHEYALEHFRGRGFDESYRRLLSPDQP
jgi:glycosyltransferase involved in cell wall biosynthesis